MSLSFVSGEIAHVVNTHSTDIKHDSSVPFSSGICVVDFFITTELFLVIDDE